MDKNKKWLCRNKEKLYFPLLEKVLTKIQQMSISLQAQEACKVRNTSRHSQLCFLFFKLQDEGDSVFKIPETVALQLISFGPSGERKPWQISKGELWIQPFLWIVRKLLGLDCITPHQELKILPIVGQLSLLSLELTCSYFFPWEINAFSNLPHENCLCFPLFLALFCFCYCVSAILFIFYFVTCLSIFQGCQL